MTCPKESGDIFCLNAKELSVFTFFQSKKTLPYLTEDNPPFFSINLETMKGLKNVFQVNYFAKDLDFIIALPYKQHNQIRMDETIAIYLIMFYLSSLVRYNPQYLENLLSKKEAWVIDSFVRSCTITFLRSMVSRITDTDYVLEGR